MPMIFVFGSNLAGRHGAGAALSAMKFRGAEYGVGIGRTGNAYAIPTKDQNLKTLPLTEIRRYVDVFIKYACDNYDLEFLVTEVGTGLAGYSKEDIAPMFLGIPDNCYLSSSWAAYLEAEYGRK